MYNFDVIVVGAGPAGLMAAYELAKFGHSVAVIEKNHNFDIIRRACSQQLILDEEYEGDIVTVNDEGFHFQNAGFTVPYHSDLVPLFAKYYHSPHDHCLHFMRNDGETPFSYKFRKADLLNGLYAKCMLAGVVFFMGTRAMHVFDDDTGVHVEAKHGTSGLTVYGKKLVLAEGVGAALADQLGMNDERHLMGGTPVIKRVFRGIKHVEPNSWNLYYGRAYHCNSPAIIGPGFDDTFELTVTGNASNGPLSIMDQFIHDSPMSHAFAAADAVDTYGCYVKARMSMRTPCKHNTIAIGDTAAMIEVEVQGAFLSGYRAAVAVDAELSGKNGWQAYTDWWLTAFEFNHDDYMKVAQGYGLVPTYSDDELDYLFGLIENVQFPGTYSQYRTPALIWDAIFDKIDTVKADDPALYAKICNLNYLALDTSLTASVGSLQHV